MTNEAWQAAAEMSWLTQTKDRPLPGATQTPNNLTLLAEGAAEATCREGKMQPKTKPLNERGQY